MAVVTPLNNFLGPEGDTVTADKHYSILNTHLRESKFFYKVKNLCLLDKDRFWPLWMTPLQRTNITEY